MPIPFDCPSCGKKIKAPDNLAGKAGKCPGCGNRIQVPEPVYEAEEVEPPVVLAQVDDGPEEEEQEERRPCPVCGEMILRDAIKCRFCGEIFDPKLKRKRKKKRADSELIAGEWVLAILCSGIGCIVGIVWMIQGKPKGTKMFAVSMAVQLFWILVRVILALVIAAQQNQL